ncbi:U32 family peptidase [uncultured Clostridium sp.]|uniref:U32 family peptidase n=1 Tax=uncultured Clostridium sp. TaxID=59620 RepID=UPI0026037E74|nr:U32 family peptidase [uncultured Clostridium sp.]
MNRIEILAPAGSMESLYAAINNGADAIYLGGDKFSARAYASNFDNEKMKLAVDYAHSYGVSVYVTMNTLLKEDELNKAIKYVGYLYEIGVDALIIQDLGLYELIRERYSDFEIHASTQMSIHNGEGALYFKDKGFHRIVLSRELSLDEIKHISTDLKIETEMFVHGALCVSYSGQCLMSSMIGGRSGNRGRCAQPCRMEYILKGDKSPEEKKGYLLSPKDMCTLEDVKGIINSGTYSLKIEGRMKRPEYVAGVVRNYRKAVDKELKKGSFNVQEGKRELLQLFNRGGFSKAYLNKNVGSDMMSYSFPRNTGMQIGRIDKGLEIVLEEDINIGDGMRINDGGFTLSKITINGEEVKTAKRGEKVKLFPVQYKKGDLVYRMSNKVLTDDLSETVKPYYKKLPLEVEVYFKASETVKLKTTFNGTEYEVQGPIVEVASKSPLDKERIEKALFKSGEHPYKIEKIIFVDFNDGFMRIGELNELRRELFGKIMKSECSKYRRRRDNKEEIREKTLKDRTDLDLLVRIAKIEQLDAVKDRVENIAVDVFNRNRDSLRLSHIKELSKTNNVYLALPSIVKAEFNLVVEKIEEYKPYIKGILTANLGIIKLYKEELEIIGDYKLNIYNSKAFKFYTEDMDVITISEELNRKEIKETLKGKKGKAAYVIYGKPEVMISEYCPIGSTFGGKNSVKECTRPCEKENYRLIDRMNEEFNIKTDIFCRSHILNNLPINLIHEKEDIESLGVDVFRLDFTDESFEETMKVLDGLEGKIEFAKDSYTKGHYRRGVE